MVFFRPQYTFSIHRRVQTPATYAGPLGRFPRRSTNPRAYRPG